jgi:hypothetical protein
VPEQLYSFFLSAGRGTLLIGSVLLSLYIYTKMNECFGKNDKPETDLKASSGLE